MNRVVTHPCLGSFVFWNARIWEFNIKGFIFYETRIETSLLLLEKGRPFPIPCGVIPKVYQIEAFFVVRSNESLTSFKIGTLNHLISVITLIEMDFPAVTVVKEPNHPNYKPVIKDLYWFKCRQHWSNAKLPTKLCKNQSYLYYELNTILTGIFPKEILFWGFLETSIDIIPLIYVNFDISCPQSLRVLWKEILLPCSSVKPRPADMAVLVKTYFNHTSFFGASDMGSEIWLRAIPACSKTPSQMVPETKHIFFYTCFH